MRLATFIILIAAAVLIRSSEGAMTVSKIFENISERGPVPRFVFKTDRATYSLIAPSTWDLQRLDSEQQEVHFSLRAVETALYLHFESTDKVGDVSPKSLSRKLLAEFPGAQVVDQTKCYAANFEGVQFEIEFPAANGELYRKRIAFFKTGAHMVEISLTAPRHQFKKVHSGWTSVLNSFRVEPKPGA